jgi:hypothetical protein
MRIRLFCLALALGLTLTSAVSARAANYTAQAGTVVRLTLGDSVVYSFSHATRVSVSYDSCNPDTNRGTFRVVKRYRGKLQERSITVGAADSGFDVEVLKFTCSSVASGADDVAVGGTALIVVPNSIRFPLTH